MTEFINDVAREFNSRIEARPELRAFKNDIGIQQIVKSIAYAYEQSQLTYLQGLGEIFSPRSEKLLLHFLLTTLGYVSFQKGMRVKFTLTSKEDINLDKLTNKLTNGKDIFLLETDINILANTPTELVVKRENVTIVNVTVKGTIFYKYKTSYTYKDIATIEVYRGVNKLKMSQGFIDYSSDYMLEIDGDGYFWVVVRLNNTHGLSIQNNDTLELRIFTTYPTFKPPHNLSLIGIVNTIVSDIQIEEPYKPFLTTREMREIYQYNKNFNNSLIYNEDFKRMITAHVAGILYIRVWQQEDEDRQEGASVEHINKVYVSYLPQTPNDNLDDKIIECIESRIEGRPVIIKTPNIVEPLINLTITNYSKRAINSQIVTAIENSLLGYYDDSERRLNAGILHNYIITNHLTNLEDVSLNVKIEGKGVALNETFYNVKIDNIHTVLGEG